MAPLPLQYVYLIKFPVLTKAITDRDVLLHFALMAFSGGGGGGVMDAHSADIHAAACADGERGDAACSDSHKSLLFSAGKPADKGL